MGNFQQKVSGKNGELTYTRLHAKTPYSHASFMYTNYYCYYITSLFQKTICKSGCTMRTILLTFRVEFKPFQSV